MLVIILTHNKMKKDKIDKFKNEFGQMDDTTKYGEFVSSYFAWVPLAKQKERAKDMENITKDKNGKKFK